MHQWLLIYDKSTFSQLLSERLNVPPGVQNLVTQSVWLTLLELTINYDDRRWQSMYILAFSGKCAAWELLEMKVLWWKNKEKNKANFKDSLKYLIQTLWFRNQKTQGNNTDKHICLVLSCFKSKSQSCLF